MNAARWICQLILFATVAVPLAANAEGWRDRCQSVRFLCVDVDVVDNGSSVSVSLPEPIEVRSSLKVIWRLPVGFAFASGDGVVVQTANHEIDLAAAVDDEEADTIALTVRYRVKVVNRLVAGPYKYVLKFHEMNGGKANTLITCDPTIANFDGILLRKHKPPLKAFTSFTCVKS